jgi:hypothetical protein
VTATARVGVELASDVLAVSSWVVDVAPAA